MKLYMVLVWSVLVWATPSIAADVPGKNSRQPGADGTVGPEEQFFPAGVLDDFNVRWYSQHLAAMGERSLSEKAPPGGVGSATEAYRFLWLRTFDHPVVVRLEDANDRYRVVLKELDGKGGYKPGKLLVEKSTEIPREDWNELARRIKECSFWKMKTNEEHSYVDKNGLVVGWWIMDGAQWILEGRRQANYHIVDRQEPDYEIDRRQLTKYRALCLHILDVAGFNRKATKGYRDREGVRAEPGGAAERGCGCKVVVASAVPAA